MPRHLSSIAVSALAMWTASTAGACQSDGADDQAQLQALLHDEPLQQVPPGAALRPTEGAAAVSRAGTTASAVPSGPPVGAWNFDDCNPERTQLFDSTFANNTAFRSVNAACTDGVQGQGVAIAATEDIVYVPDQPSFTFEGGVTVGGWFKPTATSGTRTLIRKRDRDTSSFALVLTGGKFQFVASFGNGRAASVTAPTKAKAGVFQHVAATYDGATLRLYIGGVEATSFDVAGTIPVGAGPLLMGNDGSERRFNGTIDTVTFATHALGADEVLQLTCLAESPSVVIPAELPPTPVGVPVAFDIALTNHNPPGACAPITFTLQTFESGLLLDPSPAMPAHSAPVASGETGHMTVTATAPASADPGNQFRVNFLIAEPTTNFFEFDTVPFTVAASPGCQVSTSHELMVTDLSVVDDPVRTTFDPMSSDPRNGAWTFKRLMEDMAATADDAPAMVEAVMRSFTTPQTINGFTIATRPGMQSLILASWPRTPDGKLDLARAPFQLQAIVNRFDLRNLASGDAGEGRFVFAFLDGNGHPLQATMIFEYKLPAATDSDVLGWAQSFHALGALAFGEDYNAALQAITDRFVGRGVRQGHPNGSAINAVRTNEIDFSDNGIWQLRQFGLAPSTGRLVALPVDLTPDRSFDNGATLASYINANQAQIIAETHTVPTVFDGQPFEAGAIFNDLTTWFAPGVDNDARHHFALNTCNGCHSFDETGTEFLQISPRVSGRTATLSGFLTGTTVADPVTGQSRVFDDLGRRKLDLQAIVCSGGSARIGTTLRNGIRRVH
jgi:hypothetical protein